MDIRTLQSTVIDALDDLKAQDVKAFSTVGLTDLFDRVIIATGTSNRHTKALAASVRDKVKLKGGAIVSMEGEESGEWVLVDLGDIIVHIMQPSIRNYYNLEELWGSRPVNTKPATSRAGAGSARGAAQKKTTLARAGEGEPARKSPRAKSPPRRVAKRPVSR
jgi:ribosome-associated protein